MQNKISFSQIQFPLRFFANLAIVLAVAGFIFIPAPSQAAVLYTGAANQVVYVGETFIVEWYLDTQDKPINSLSLQLTFSPEKLQVLDLSVGDSALDLWVKAPEFDNSKGEISLVGGISAGVANSKLRVMRATFQPLTSGLAKLSLKKESEALIADGLGTSAGVIFTEVNFTVNPRESKPARVESSSHPNQDAWSQEHNAKIKIETKPGEDYSYSFSSNLEIFPDQSADEVSEELTFNDLPDGIYYFKLNSKVGAGNWQEAAVYRIKIDNTPPQEFLPTIGKDPAVFDGQAFISFSTTDNTSGILYYEVRSSIFGGWHKTDSLYYKLPGLVLGDSVEVKVVDAAGNERISRVKVDKSVGNELFSKLRFWGIIVLSLIAAILIVRIYLKLLKKYKVDEE